MRLRIPLALTHRTAGALVASALLSTAGFAQTTSPSNDMTRHPATMSQAECEQLTDGNRTDCERRAQEMTSERGGAEAGSSDPSSASSPHQRARTAGDPASESASETRETATDRTRVSQGETSPQGEASPETDAEIGGTDPASASSPHQRARTAEDRADDESADARSKDRTRLSKGTGEARSSTSGTASPSTSDSASDSGATSDQATSGEWSQSEEGASSSAGESSDWSTSGTEESSSGEMDADDDMN